jgi:2-aminoethylphosphonate-pyruvate transaminase
MYLDLSRYLAQQDAGGTPFTQSVQTFYALDAALVEFFAAGGVAARHALYAGRLGRVRETLRRLGVSPLLPDGDCSCVLHAFELPSGTDYAALHDALKARGFVIYAGQGRLASRIFRISTMGEIGEDDLARFCAALEAFFAG